MDDGDSRHSWFGPSVTEEKIESVEELQVYRRLWLGFMTARVMLSLGLLVLQLALFVLGQTATVWLVLLCAAYFAATLIVRIAPRPRRLGPSFDGTWLLIIGVDVLTFTALHLLHGSSINYNPLYVLPVLLAAVLGSLLLAMGTAAGVTLLLMLHGVWMTLHPPGEATQHFIQAALTGAGCFVVAFLANQMATRLASQQQRARHSLQEMRMQQQVNDLVIESISDGILVVDVRGTVHAANPAARLMLQTHERPIKRTPFHLGDEPGWQELTGLAFQNFSGRGDFLQADVTIEHPGTGLRNLRVRTRMTVSQWGEQEILCVMFLQDLREMEARMRTEKLASMGRMSAAVAHEIRNPLAAISQANALLDEDLSDPRLKRLTQMIQQNTHRLDKIVEGVLNIARAGARPTTFEPHALDLSPAVSRMCNDWAQQNTGSDALRMSLSNSPGLVNFESEHLRRVLVNLLDNALRHASRLPESIQVATHHTPEGEVLLGVWSDGPLMEPSVQKHLFEPFFSSESRSSGLGLYICRELCVGHGAAINYQRVRRIARNSLMDGNEFIITFQRAPAPGHLQPQPGGTVTP